MKAIRRAQKRGGLRGRCSGGGWHLGQAGLGVLDAVEPPAEVHDAGRLLRELLGRGGRGEAQSGPTGSEGKSNIKRSRATKPEIKMGPKIWGNQ